MFVNLLFYSITILLLLYYIRTAKYKIISNLIYVGNKAYFFVFCLMISPIAIKIKRNNISIVYSITILFSTVPSS